MKKVWYAVVAVVVIVLAIGSLTVWSIRRKQAVEKYIPKGSPERIEQMQKMPAATGEQPPGQP